MTPSSSTQHIVGMTNGCNGDNISSDHSLERDGRKSSISSMHSTSHSPHRNFKSHGVYDLNQQTNGSHHHSLDRESNNKMHRDNNMATRFYNTNPKPHAHTKQKQTQKIQHSNNNQLARQSMPMKNITKSQSNLSNTTIISKSDANMAINSSDDECQSNDRSIQSQCNNDIYKNRHMILASNKSSKQYCKYHNFN